ncbi:hypothetical protein Btru_055357 [Bulinus truncatus]|nr:hypothetical protein Btru_055357 [Bulinus truncatus]
MAAGYGCPDAGNMSDTRYAQWLSRTGKRKAKIAPKLKSLPPTSEAFEENVKRAHIQTCIWKNALLRDPPNLDPTKFGWQKDDCYETENCQNPLTKINVLVDEVDVESDSGSDVESEID